MLKRLYTYGLVFGIGLGLYLLSVQVSDVVSQKSTVLVQGSVQADNASPLRGVWVSLIRQSESGLTDSDLMVSLGGAAVVRVQTGPDGRFAIELPVGRYDVRASENGFQTFSNDEPFEVRPGVATLSLDVTMVPTASISGRVKGALGSGVSGIVIASPTGDPELPGKQSRVTDGRFDVIGLEPGSYRVEVRVPGFVPASVEEVSLSAGDRLKDLVVSPERGRQVSGVVTDAAGRPLGDAEVVAKRVDGNRTLLQSARTDEKGQFHISGLIGGRYELEARFRGFSGATHRLEIASEDLIGTSLTLEALGRVTGALVEVDSDEVSIYAIPEDAVDQPLPTNDWIQGDFDKSGTYEIVGIPEGAYYLAAIAPGFLKTFLPGTHDANEAGTITILDGEVTKTESFGLLPGSTLSGDALTRGSGLAIAGATVELVALDRREARVAVTDSEGRFELRGIGPGRYMVKVTSSGHIAQFFPGVTQADEATPLEVDGVQNEANISIALPLRAPADFNADGMVDVVDLDRFVNRVKAGGVASTPVFDANLDGLVTHEDFDAVVQETRLRGQVIDPPILLSWRSTDAESGRIRADLKVEDLDGSVGYLVRVHFDTEEATFVGYESGESIYKDGMVRVDEVGPGVLLLIGGTTDRSQRDGAGSLVSLLFDPKEEKGSVRVRTERGFVLQEDGKLASPSLPDPVRLALPPDSFYLLQNVPNPFNPETTIAYELPEAVQVKLAIFNLVGQRVRSLVDEFKTAGRYEARWDGQDDFGRDVGSGVYFYSLEAGTFSTTKRMLLIR